MKSPIALLDHLLQDFKRWNPGVKGLDRDLVTIQRRFEHEGDGFLTVALPALDDAFVQGINSGQFTCPTGFKKARGSAIPLLLSGMLSKVFDTKTGLLVEPIEYGIIRDVHTFLKLCKKAQLPPSNEEYLHEKAVEEFYQCDETAKSVKLTDRQDHLIGHVGRLILVTLNSKDLEDDYIYRHGPGAVEESCSGNQKWNALYGELRSSAHIPEWFGFTSAIDLPDWASLSPAQMGADPHEEEIPSGRPVSCSRQELQTYREYSSAEAAIGALSGPCQGTDVCLSGAGDARLETSGNHHPVSNSQQPRGASARLISVLKNSTSRRTITIEPMLRMYLQQGLNTVLRESITECGILRNCLALTDQSKNQKLALEGSRAGNWATIDLKSASDLLSLSLVESVFRYHPNFLRCMMDSRSPLVHTSGLNKPELTLGKYAGMGNATTFPVQSICFAVVCIAAILDKLGRKASYGEVRRASRMLRIYGDDIIVRTEHSHQVVKWLQDVGLKVNVKKSFLEGNFRESCGVEAFKGVDITPLYIRHWPHNIGESPNVCAHLVSLSNHMWLQGLHSASNYLKEIVEKHLRRRLPLVSSQSGSFGWVTRQDAITPHKWCKNTHQFLTRTFALTPIKQRDKLDGYPALFKSLTTPLLGRDVDHLEKTVRRFKNRLTLRWVPSYSYEGLNLQV